MEIPVLRGRALTRRDDEKAPKVAVINEAAVRDIFPVRIRLVIVLVPVPRTVHNSKSSASSVT